MATEAIIDLGAHLTDIVIHHQGVPRVVRTVAQGGELLTASLMETLGLRRDDAERAKIGTGLVGDDVEVAAVLAMALRPCLAEIRSSIQYFATTGHGARVDGVAVTGGAAALPGLRELLSEQVGVPVRVVAPLQHVREGRRARPEATIGLGDHDGCATAVSVGLALGSAA